MNDRIDDAGAVTQGGAGRATLPQVREVWCQVTAQQQLELFLQLPFDDAQELFEEIGAHERAEIIQAIPPRSQHALLMLLEPHEVADVIQQCLPDRQPGLLSRLGSALRAEVVGLMNYSSDVAGGMMSARYASLKPSLTAGEALSYLRQRARARDADIYYVYVLEGKRLVGVVSLRELMAADVNSPVSTFMDQDVVVLTDQMDQEEVSRVFARTKLLALPVVDANREIKGIVDIGDAMKVVQQETTEDTQKMGGVEALGDRYLQVRLGEMVRKRGVWLAALFFGEMFTASAMSYYEHEIAAAVVLALFLPLIISSGGNSGSQASTLVVRAMALGEVRLRDWWRVMRRELVLGLSLGGILGTIGLARIILWHTLGLADYGAHYMLVGLTVGLSLMAIVTWGSLSGSLLPFLLRACKVDPATASTPAVATIVDVTGLVIYFSIASLILKGTLL